MKSFCSAVPRRGVDVPNRCIPGSLFSVLRLSSENTIVVSAREAVNGTPTERNFPLLDMWKARRP
jgi:hypothetical protein